MMVSTNNTKSNTRTINNQENERFTSKKNGKRETHAERQKSTTTGSEQRGDPLPRLKPLPDSQYTLAPSLRNAPEFHRWPLDCPREPFSGRSKNNSNQLVIRQETVESVAEKQCPINQKATEFAEATTKIFTLKSIWRDAL